MDMDVVLGATSPGDCPQTRRSVWGRNCGGARDPGPWHTGQWSPPVEARPQSHHRSSPHTSTPGISYGGQLSLASSRDSHQEENFACMFGMFV